jgi:cell division septation protein DedD
MSNLPAIPSSGDLVPQPSGMCPLCGADTAPGQEYCLECGERLVAAPVLTGDAVAQVLPFTRASWFWPAVVGFLIAGVAAGVIVVTGAAHKKPKVLKATPQFLTVSTPTRTVVKTAPAATTPGSTAATKTTKARPATLIDWPATKSSAYTVVLVSLPSAGGHAAALAQAHKALGAGLQQVGVLDSARFATLHPGYFVVFSGIFSSYSDAGSALSQAHANGFSAAYVRQVSR